MKDGLFKTYVTAKVSPLYSKDIKKTVASKDKKYEIPELDNITIDLAPFKIVLVSEKENLNGDFFNRSELIQARGTPINKPFNIEHTVSEDESYISQPYFNRTKNTIVGHMIYSALADKSGNVLSDKEIEKIDASDNPNRDDKDCLDIVAVATLYQFYFPKTVADIKESSEKNKMFVSMECWFRGYDFLVDGKIIERTELNNDFYTEKWRNQEKGSDGKRICRVLKGVIFGGVGATPNPANPESVFLSMATMNQELEQLKRRHDELHVLYSFNPMEEYKKEHDAVEKSVASLENKISEKSHE